MTDRYVAKAIVDVCLFLEFTDDRLLDPDAAVSAMEQLGANLQRVGDEDIRTLSAEIRSVAPDYPTREQFIRDLPEALGISGE